MFDCLTKRRLSKVDDSIPVFSLNNYRGYARITSVYDGDTFKACIILDGRVKKFIFRTLGYDAPEMKPRLIIDNRDQYIQDAILAREMFKEDWVTPAVAAVNAKQQDVSELWLDHGPDFPKEKVTKRQPTR